ncbi:phage holin [Streptococcus infantis]|uniref:phage holin n=1 Tax=Streptococcus infantis TaxID=68892 RepID=UPI0039C213C6
MKINWLVRFKNRAFVIRLLLAIILPILTYFGLKFEDLTSWSGVYELLLKFLSNPYLIGLSVFSALNIVPDPTTAGLSDSERAMAYTEPK